MATGVTTPETASDNQYFYEDEVFRIDKQGRVKFGLVLENEAYSTDEENDYDDVLSKGEIRIAWHPDGKEDILYEKTVGLADRTLMPGDVVRRLVPGKDTQRGYCHEINMKADLKIVGTKYVIKNVMAERLRPLVKYNRDNAVCLDSWVGSTKCVNEKIILRSSCGAILEVPDIDLCPLKDRNTKFRNGLFAETVFYPGQTLTGRIGSLDNVKLLTPSVNLNSNTNKKGKLLDRRFVVQSVQLEGVWVHWQCKALSEDGSDLKANILQQPKPYVSGDDLKRLKYLNLFESCMLQINDKNYLKISDCDAIVKKAQWEKEQAIKYKLILSQQQKDENHINANRNIKVSSRNAADKIKIKLTHSNLLDVDNKKHLINKSTKSSNISSSYTITKHCVENNVDVSNIDNNIDKIGNTTVNMRSETASKITSSDNDIVKINDNKLKPNIEVIPSSDGWLTDEECDDIDIDDIDGNSISESTTATISTGSSPTPKSSPKCSPLLNKKQIKKLKKNIVNTPIEKIPSVGDQVVTEALVVYSTATVVWQDGTIETCIPSTQLYPIHHLDDHEFFPGDFVLSGKVSDVSFRDYGVIQTVDHQGRTAHVKWFTTYTSADDPKPTFAGESEASVYDLKDHPDFQYRPGTIVIRVANFVGEDTTCTAGQIIDNYVDGRVKVWWVDGHISMCWPQDLFEVGQYDADNNFWGNNESDNDSWETESEMSEPGGTPQKGSGLSAPHLAINLERARVAMSRLEEIFNINPNLQNQEVMRKLLAVYKKCRYLDRLMNTSFFHEDNFMGMLERVRKGGTQSQAERAQDQKNRLFNQFPTSKQQLNIENSGETNNTPHSDTDVTIISSPREYSPKIILNLSSTPFKYSSAKKKVNKLDLNISNPEVASITSTNNAPIVVVESTSTLFDTNNVSNTIHGTNNVVNGTVSGNITSVVLNATKISSQQQPMLVYNSNNKTITADPKNYYSNEKNKLLSSVMCHIEKATQETEKSNQLKMHTTSLHASGSGTCGGAGSTSQDDSGNYSRTNDFCDGSSTSYASSNDLTTDVINTSLLRANDDLKSVSCSSIELTDDSPEYVCARLCTLLKGQLVKALQEIQQKYCKNILNLSDVVEYLCPDDNENEIEINENEKNVNGDEIADENKDDNLIVDSKNVLDVSEINVTPSTDTVNEQSPTEETAASFDSASSLYCRSASVDCFQIIESAPNSHKFHLTIFHPASATQYYRAVRKEHKLLKTSLPPGVWVRVFEDRMDLISVMIEGPKNTPYEDGMFFFDIQLGRDYPKTPPLCHYVSYCPDRLNPNLYEDGKVCVSLLGTWSGRDSEIWGTNSTLLQVIVSIQGLILVAEPYFNEAGYEKQKNTQQGIENSRLYNEMVVIKLVQSMTKIISSPPIVFREQILKHFQTCGKSMYDRIKGWMDLSQQHNSPNESKTVKSSELEKIKPPEFPLVPASRGFCLTLTNLLENFYSKIESINNKSAIQNVSQNNETVDHQGRTAHVKWFTTYTSADDPKPTFAGESEASVYDLKDHPDFQYRPGTIVIRVANFVGEDTTCTAGQIIDNYVDGRVKVWWVDGHISMCWPQDLFEVGQYDADNNFWGNNESDNDSWETESEMSEPGGTPQKGSGLSAPHLAINLERARVAMSRLEEIFNINPNLQNQEVMRKLLAVYKKCRYLDRLMNTSFFHEDNFMGMLERVRKGGTQSQAERAQDQKNRLFNQFPTSKQQLNIENSGETNNTPHSDTDVTIISSPREYSPKIILNLSSTPFKYSSAKKKVNKLDLNISNPEVASITSTNNAPIVVVESTSTLFDTNNVSNTIHGTNNVVNGTVSGNITSVVLNATKISSQQQPMLVYNSNNKTITADPKNYYSNEKNKLLSSVMCHIEKATQETEKSNQLKMHTTSLHASGSGTCGGAGSTSQDDSGNYSRTNDFCDGSSTSYASSNDLTTDVINTSLLRANDDLKSVSCSSIELTDDSPEYVCARLCTLLKGQLVKALQEIQQKYCKNILNLSDVVEYLCPDDNENEIEINENEKNVNGDEIADENKDDNLIVDSKNVLDVSEINVTPSTDTVNEQSPTEETAASFDSASSLYCRSASVDCFQIIESAPNSHKFHLTIFHPASATQYYRAVRKEHKLLKTSLPPGVWVRVFEDRMDLISVMIEGPKNTPYEDGMFFFDIQLGRDYPKTPPLCHYVSYCPDRLNPNLYEDGKVCVSLLGTWSGRDSEIWGTNSTLLQVIVSIQGLILVAEPYFNEAGYEKQKNTQQGIENSRLYNEMVVIKLVQSMTKIISSPPIVFREQILKHFQTCGKSMYDRIKGWMDLSQQHNSPNESKTVKSSELEKIKPPEFPLVPASRGFCLTLTNLLENFYSKIESINNKSAIQNVSQNNE